MTSCKHENDNQRQIIKQELQHNRRQTKEPQTEIGDIKETDMIHVSEIERKELAVKPYMYVPELSNNYYSIIRYQ